MSWRVHYFFFLQNNIIFIDIFILEGENVSKCRINILYFNSVKIYIYIYIKCKYVNIYFIILKINVFFNNFQFRFKN